MFTKDSLSVELGEIKSLANRIAVMYNGEIVAVVGTDEVTKSEWGLLMAGSKRQNATEAAGG